MSLRHTLSSTLTVALVLHIELVDGKLIVTRAHVALATGVKAVDALPSSLHSFLRDRRVPILRRIIAIAHPVKVIFIGVALQFVCLINFLKRPWDELYVHLEVLGLKHILYLSSVIN